MKAIVKDVVKAEHPRNDQVSGVDVNTPVVIVEVDFVHDNGDLHSTQKYALLPEEVDLEMFDRQAEVMQRSIDEAIQAAQRKDEQVKIHRPTDEAVDKLRKHFKLDLGEKIPVNEATETR